MVNYYSAIWAMINVNINMIVVEFDLQFLFVVSDKFFRKISHRSGEEEKWSAQKNLDCQGLIPPVWPFYWKQSEEMTPPFWGEGRTRPSPPPPKKN